MELWYLWTVSLNFSSSRNCKIKNTNSLLSEDISKNDQIYSLRIQNPNNHPKIRSFLKKLQQKKEKNSPDQSIPNRETLGHRSRLRLKESRALTDRKPGIWGFERKKSPGKRNFYANRGEGRSIRILMGARGERGWRRRLAAAFSL